MQVRVYADRVMEANIDEDDSPALADGSPDSPTCSRDADVSMSSATAPGTLRVSNPLHFQGIADYAQGMLDDNTHVSAWGYTRPLHPQTDNPFVQSDGKKPAYAVSNITNGRVEGGHKDAKHTQGSSGPVKLPTFLQSQLQLSAGARERWFVGLQRLPEQLQSQRRQESMAKREVAWQESPEAALCASPGSNLCTTAAILAGLLPAACRVLLTLPCSAPTSAATCAEDTPDASQAAANTADDPICEADRVLTAVTACQTTPVSIASSLESSRSGDAPDEKQTSGKSEHLGLGGFWSCWVACTIVATTVK